MQSSTRSWVPVPCDNPSAAPRHRSLHACAVCKDSLYVFGGYDGSNRTNDFYEFNFNRKLWSVVLAIGSAPSPRDRHVAVVYKNSFFVFAGFDGSSRVNDFVEYNFSTQRWRDVMVTAGMPPTARHSHAAVVYGESMFCFGGYDGNYRNDFHEFNFETNVWSPVSSTGLFPRPRYRASLVLHNNTCVLFGGHDGSHHLDDIHVFDFDTRVWSWLTTQGPAPAARDSHVAGVHLNSMYIFGGSTGTAVNDFYQLNFESNTWRPMQFDGQPPEHRFCHVGTVYDSSLIIFGGYDGNRRLNDFQQFRFKKTQFQLDIPEGTLTNDLRMLVNNDIMSDVTFIVEGIPVYGHKILCIRCYYFNAMLTGEMLESRAREISITEVRRPVFLLLMEYLYTDYLDVAVDIAMELFATADRYGVERLKRICEDLHNATLLRDQCITFILSNFDAVTKTEAFEDMGRTNVELVFELLKRR